MKRSGSWEFDLMRRPWSITTFEAFCVAMQVPADCGQLRLLPVQGYNFGVRCA